jgi:hypothetical protein
MISNMIIKAPLVCCVSCVIVCMNERLRVQFRVRSIRIVSLLALPCVISIDPSPFALHSSINREHKSSTPAATADGAFHFFLNRLPSGMEGVDKLLSDDLDHYADAVMKMYLLSSNNLRGLLDYYCVVLLVF